MASRGAFSARDSAVTPLFSLVEDGTLNNQFDRVCHSLVVLALAGRLSPKPPKRCQTRGSRITCSSRTVMPTPCGFDGFRYT